MNEMKRTLDRLRDTITGCMQERGGSRRYPEVGAKIRENVIRLLRRDDLRITVEALLRDLRNCFSGFETLDVATREKVMKDALGVIEILDSLVASDQALNPDRIDLPEPPDSMRPLVEAEEKRLRKDAKRNLDRLRAESNKLRSRRSANRLSQKDSGDKGRDHRKTRRDLKFASGEKQSDRDRTRTADDGRTKIEANPGGDAKTTEKGIANSGTPRKSRRGRRRSRRPRN